jgi:excinuclease ABC subunit C
MDLHEKIRLLPTQPGVYLYKNAEGDVIYVGKANNLRSRVRSYLLEASQANAKTGSLMREAVDIDYILVANEHEALALENNLIKQRKPRFNILLRDDKTYPYVKLTLGDRFPKVFVTRRLRKDGSAYYGPYFPGNLAYRVVELIHRSFLLPSCKVDLSRYHPRACLQYYIHRCLGPCVEDFVTREAYAQAVRDAQLFLEGRHAELERTLTTRMLAAAAAEQYEAAARLRDQLSTVHQLQEKQRIATVEQSDDADVFGYHFEDGYLAVNLFHMRSGKIVDRREFFWEDQPDFDEPLFFSSLLKQIYLDQQYVPAEIHSPVEFEDREALEELLSEKRGRRVEIRTPQRGQKKALLDLVENNAKHSFNARFHVLKPSSKAIQEALQEALNLPSPPARIECFDISHIQGTDKVASMVVWEDGRMKKADYRKFIIKTVIGNDDFASMREVVTRRYSRLQEENLPLPGLVLIDGGLGQLHAAAGALEAIGIIDQPLASIAKREEIIYVYGQEDEPVILDRFSPILHLVQSIRDEAHRFAVTFHRSRRNARTLTSELDAIKGVGGKTVQRLLKEFGSSELVRTSTEDQLAAVVGRAAARKVRAHYAEPRA